MSACYQEPILLTELRLCCRNVMTASFIERIERINYLIRIKGTGTPQQLASRLEISVRTVYETIEFLKQMGAPIAYCKKRQSYYYHEEGEFCFGFIKK